MSKLNETIGPGTMTKAKWTIGHAKVKTMQERTQALLATERKKLFRAVEEAGDNLESWQRTLNNWRWLLEDHGKTNILEIVDDALQAIAGINDLLKELERED